MGVAELKEKLRSYIATGDEKLLRLMYAVAREYNEVEDDYATVSDAEKIEIRQREENRLTGRSKTYSLAEVKKQFRRKKS